MEIIIERNFRSILVEVFARNEKSGHMVYYWQEGDQMIAKTFDINEYPAEVKPLLAMPMHMFDEFVKAMLDYANDIGIKSVNENLMQGRLQATEDALEFIKPLFAQALKSVLKK